VRGRTTDRFDRAKKLGRSENALWGGGEETTERAGNRGIKMSQELQLELTFRVRI